MSLIIGIAGGSGAGKTTSAGTIAQYIEETDGYDILRISLDSFYKDHSEFTEEEKKKINYDDPDEWEWEETNRCIKELSRNKKEKEVLIPQYDFKTHERKEEKEIVHPADVILIEGIYALYNEDLNRKIDAKIYTEAVINKRYPRRLCRDITERGRTLESVLDQFIETVQPMHSEHVEEQIDKAEYTIDGNKELEKMETEAREIAEEIIKRFEGNKEKDVKNKEARQAPVV